MNYKYKTITFNCVFNTAKSFDKKLQSLLDKYSKEGWRLHTMQVAGGFASTCVCVFEKED